MNKSTSYSCCSKLICLGCFNAYQRQEVEGRRIKICPFCRKPIPFTDEEIEKRRMKRVEANDPNAISGEGRIRFFVKEDYRSAFEYFTKASDLGDANAHIMLAQMYRDGKGVENDRGKKIHHLEEAAVRGHPNARYNLGCDEWENGNTERAVKHFIIAATQGHDGSIKSLMVAFKVKAGFVSKEDLAALSVPTRPQ
eukprot:scaffold4052_cov132-Skeletonema_menzelii.AAC.4